LCALLCKSTERLHSLHTSHLPVSPLALSCISFALSLSLSLSLCLSLFLFPPLVHRPPSLNPAKKTSVHAVPSALSLSNVYSQQEAVLMLWAAHHIQKSSTQRTAQAVSGDPIPRILDLESTFKDFSGEILLLDQMCLGACSNDPRPLQPACTLIPSDLLTSLSSVLCRFPSHLRPLFFISHILSVPSPPWHVTFSHLPLFSFLSLPSHL
jgi:hypothetical protein